MALRLSIENVPSLPDGGPISFTLTGRRTIDIGRDQHLDWTLPDPTRHISGKHCEIHCRDDSYWLHDVSTNGTFLHGSDQRVRTPYELKNADRLVIGHYIIAVSMDENGRVALSGSQGAASTAYQQHAAYPELWNTDRDAPPPVDRNQILSSREAPRPISPDFLDWAAGVPEAEVRPARPRAQVAPVETDTGMDWASGPVSRSSVPAEAPLPIAAPRRPVGKDDRNEAEVNPFGAAPQPAAAPLAQPDDILARKRPPTETWQGPATPESSSELPAGGRNFVRRVARAAALPEDFFASKDTEQLADQLGELMRIAVTNLMSLLQARNEAKRLTRSTSHTTIQATENNPLKFSPTPEEAMRILFGPKTHSFMEARKAFEQGFSDLKLHQLKTYAAMQHAVAVLIADFDPAEIAKGMEEQEAMLDRLRSRKSRLWDAFVMRWKASLGREPGAAIEAFMLHFADFYDQNSPHDSR